MLRFLEQSVGNLQGTDMSQVQKISAFGATVVGYDPSLLLLRYALDA